MCVTITKDEVMNLGGSGRGMEGDGGRGKVKYNEILKKA